MLLFSQTQNLRSDPANSKTLCQKNHSKFFSKFFSTFSFASKHLKFYYIAQYSRLRSTNFGSQCTHFWLEFFDDHYIFGILTCTIYNKIFFWSNLINFTLYLFWHFSYQFWDKGCQK